MSHKKRFLQFFDKILEKVKAQEYFMQHEISWIPGRWERYFELQLPAHYEKFLTLWCPLLTIWKPSSRDLQGKSVELFLYLQTLDVESLLPLGLLIMKTEERTQWRLSGNFIVNFVHISGLFPVFPLMTLKRWMFAGLGKVFLHNFITT